MQIAVAICESRVYNGGVKYEGIVTGFVTKGGKMTRTISTSMAGVLERLELERPTVVTSEMLSHILREEGIQTPTRIVASRLRERGWLLPTTSRGVWEFAPASYSGAFSSNDPLLPIKAFISKNNDVNFGLTFQSSAWMHGVADRVPAHLEVAVGNAHTSGILPEGVSASIFTPHLAYETIKGIPVLSPESVIVHMATKPRAVRSWQSALEWLPDLAGLLKVALVQEEILGRSNAVIARTGYLLQGMRPDVAETLFKKNTPSCKTWFGPRVPLLRHDNKWLIADTLLPFNPREMEVSV